MIGFPVLTLAVSTIAIAASTATDKANVKLIACSKAQTVSAADKAILAKNSFTKCAEPFGVLVAGSKGMSDFTVLQTAKIMAELLDQNKDGVADDPKVVAKLKCNAWMAIHNKALSEGNWSSMSGRTLYWEVDKYWYQNGKPITKAKGKKGKKYTNRVRVEEVHHVITQIGYGLAYPKVFGTTNWNSNSMLVKECKKARCDWWMHPENKCLKKKPLIKTNMNCMKTSKSYPGEVYPYNGGVKCTAAQNKATCDYPSCDCIEWYHQVNLLYAGQKPGWISKFRDEAGLTGDKVMPKTKAAMIKLLKKKAKPLLAVLQNKKYNQLQKPMTFDYPVVSGTAPILSAC